MLRQNRAVLFNWREDTVRLSLRQLLDGNIRVEQGRLRRSLLTSGSRLGPGLDGNRGHLRSAFKRLRRRRDMRNVLRRERLGSGRLGRRAGASRNMLRGRMRRIGWRRGGASLFHVRLRDCGLCHWGLGWHLSRLLRVMVLVTRRRRWTRGMRSVIVHRGRWHIGHSRVRLRCSHRLRRQIGAHSSCISTRGRPRPHGRLRGVVSLDRLAHLVVVGRDAAVGKRRCC